MELTREETALLLESLRHTKRAFAEYQSYPSEQFRREQIERVDRLAAKFRHLEKKGW